MQAAFNTGRIKIGGDLDTDEAVDEHYRNDEQQRDEEDEEPGEFVEDFEQTMEEYRHDYKDRPILISYEDSSLQFIPRSRRKKGKWLYEAPHGRVRFNGALYISQQAAKAVWEEVLAHKCYIASDHFYVHLYDKGLVQILWCEPSLATQGSFLGKFNSTQGPIKNLEGLRWRFKYAYKRLIYWLR